MRHSDARVIGNGAERRKVGVFGLLGVAVVFQMIGAVGVEPRAHRRRAQPFADPIVDLLVRMQRPVRRVVHQDRQPQLPRADQHQRKHIGQRVGPEHEHRARGEDQPPGARDQHQPAPG